MLAYLETLKTLPPNWDGYGADAPNPAVVDAAAAYLREVAARTNLLVPYAGPTRTGGVGFIWDHGPHGFEIEFESPVDIVYCYMNSETYGGIEGKLSPHEMPDPDLVARVSALHPV